MSTPTDTLEFTSPINLEGSWGARNLSKNAASRMDLFLLPCASVGFIEWDVPALDIHEHIGLTFDLDDAGKRTLTDYDGVMTLPAEAILLCERNGIDCADMRASLAS